MLDFNRRLGAGLIDTRPKCEKCGEKYEPTLLNKIKHKFCRMKAQRYCFKYGTYAER